MRLVPTEVSPERGLPRPKMKGAKQPLAKADLQYPAVQTWQERKRGELVAARSSAVDFAAAKKRVDCGFYGRPTDRVTLDAINGTRTAS